MIKAQMAKGFSVEDASWAERLIKLLNEFRDIDPEFTPTQMLVFIQVGLNKNITQRELAEKTKLSTSTVSRICALLTDRGLGKRKGFDLISYVDAGDDFRLKRQGLTPKGARLFERVRKHMEA